MKGNVTRRSRIAALAFALIFMISSMATTVVLTAPAGATLPARIQTTASNFTYNAMNGNFSVSADPVYYGTSSGYIPTDWGSAGVHQGAYTFIGMAWEVHAPFGGWFDLRMNYWYYNGSGTAGRPFQTDWSDWYEIQNDAYAAVFERYAQSPSAYSGVDEWNATVRIAILYEDPVVVADAWIRCVNPASLIKNYDVNPVYHELGDYTGLTIARDDSRSMGYLVQNAGNWAFGVIGNSPSTTPNAMSASTIYMTNRTEMRPTEAFHTRTITVLGQDLAGIQAMADNIGTTWSDYQERADHHLVIAKNGEAFDCLSYFPDDGYTIYPSGANEVVIEDGAKTTHVLGANRIFNYQKDYVVTTADDYAYTRGGSATWDGMLDLAEKYRIPITLVSTFNVAAPTLQSYAAMAAELNGTMYEFADHGYDHTNMGVGQSYAATYAIWAASAAAWATVSSTPLHTEALPYNAWAYNTWDAIGGAGGKNMRLGQIEVAGPRDYNISGSPIWVTGWETIDVWSVGDDAKLALLNMKGALVYQAHVSDWDEPSEMTLLETWWQWVQNQTTVQAVTYSQWSDLWHHRLAYSEVDGMARIDLTAAQSNHYVEVGADADGMLPLLWDVTTDAAARTVSGNSSSITVVLTAGHVYQEVASVKITGSVTYRLTSFDLDGPTLAQVTANGTNGSAMEFVFGNLIPGDVYDVYVDGARDATSNMVSSAGYINYTYDGPWSSHMIEWIQGQSVADILNAFMPLIAIALVLSIVSVVIGGNGSKKK